MKPTKEVTFLEICIQEFQEYVWRRGLRDLIKACRVKGMAGQLGAYHMRTWNMAGIVLISLHRSSIEAHPVLVLVLDEDGPQTDPYASPVRIGSNYTNDKEACEYLRTITVHWLANLDTINEVFTASSSLCFTIYPLFCKEKDRVLA